MNVIVRSLAYNDIVRLNKIFHQINIDKTKYIIIKELQQAMKQCNMDSRAEQV